MLRRSFVTEPWAVTPARVSSVKRFRRSMSARFKICSEEAGIQNASQGSGARCVRRKASRAVILAILVQSGCHRQDGNWAACANIQSSHRTVHECPRAHRPREVHVDEFGHLQGRHIVSAKQAGDARFTDTRADEQECVVSNLFVHKVDRCTLD